MECLQVPALCVGEIDEEIDFNQLPTSGEEYIKRVVIESRKCAEVVVADIDKKHLKEATINVEPLSGCIEAPASLGPTLEWQQCQVADFFALRSYVSQLKNEIQTDKLKLKPLQIELPTTRNGWITFCSGDQNTNIPACNPTLNLLLSLNQPMVEHILEYLIEYVQTEEKIEHTVGRWLYALLCVLEVPLYPDACSCLRTLARTCSIIRANSKQLEVHEIGALNLFICLVARYFAQSDLADS